MDHPSIGFVGGGRVATIIVAGLDRAGQRPPRVVVSDPSPTALEALGGRVPGIELTSDNVVAATCDVVFLAVHPPVIREVAAQIAPHLRPDAVVISLAPKLTLGGLVGMFGGFDRIVRVIPNAPSIVGAGYNPVCFGPGVDITAHQVVLDLLDPLGECPQVAEADLEPYAILTAMGPTYLWFQLYELLDQAASSGLDRETAQRSLRAMVEGTLATMEQSGLPAAEVMDLVAIRPLGEGEASVLELYRSNLPPLLARLRP
jgi:pyrroline-5-carboxylate reductase